MFRDRKPQGSTVEDAVEKYLEYGVESGGSRSSMSTALNDFIDFCDRERISTVDELDSSDLREFGMYLRERNIDGEIAGSTANTYFKYVRAFLTFCVRDEQIDTNPADTERAEEFLPEDQPVSKQQFWEPEQRKRLVSYATERVEMALEETIDVSREVAYRDRTVAVLLAEVGVRGAEIFRDTNDEKRDGLLWSHVDLERGRIEVFGKSRRWEPVGLTEAAQAALERLYRVQDPPTAEWPVFPTEHAPSKYGAVETATGERPEPGSDIDSILRDEAIAPPSITKQSGRDIMRKLTEEAQIDVGEGYLKPHGGRRSLGGELYEKGHSEIAQSALRHNSIETTHEYYSDIQAEDVAKSIDEVRE